MLAWLLESSPPRHRRDAGRARALELWKFVLSQLARGADPLILEGGYLRMQLDALSCVHCNTRGAMKLVAGVVFRREEPIPTHAFVCTRCGNHILPDPKDIGHEAASAPL